MGNPLSIILGIFVGMAATLSLQSFLSLQINQWIAFSIIVVSLSIFFIYLIIDTGDTKNKWGEAIRIISVVFVTFIPFSFQKISNIEYPLPFYGLMIHFILIGVINVLLSNTRKSLMRKQ